MEIKIIFLADSHLGFDFILKPKKEKRRRGPDFFKNFDKIIEYAKQVKADLIIHGGDLFYRTRVPEPIIDLVYERIFKIANYGIPLVIVPGNHESSRLPASLFMQHPNIFYFTKPQVFKFNLQGINFDIAGFPCVRDDIRGKFPEIVREINYNFKENSVKLLCMHQTVEGATVGPADYTFKSGKDVIPNKDIPSNYNAILSGHIHRSQILWVNQIPVIYPGSIERTAFTEKDETKGFYEITFNQRTVMNYQFIELETRPMIDIELNSEDYDQNQIEKDILFRIKNIPEDSIIRLKMKYPGNVPLLSVKLLDRIIPVTMNYQVSGFLKA
ncbi:MAG: DNA repair exonuclease [Bacteroidales bacterium]